MSYNNDNDDNITKKLEVKLTLTKNNNERYIVNKLMLNM